VSITVTQGSAGSGNIFHYGFSALAATSAGLTFGSRSPTTETISGTAYTIAAVHKTIDNSNKTGTEYTLTVAIQNTISDTGWDSLTYGTSSQSRTGMTKTTSGSYKVWKISSSSDDWSAIGGSGTKTLSIFGPNVPPTITSVTHDDAAAGSVQATVNIGTSGTGGTGLKYAQTSTNVKPTTGYQTSNLFSHTRGTTKYYWASRDTGGSITSASTSLVVGYLDPADVDVADSTVSFGTTSTNITIPTVGGTGTDTVYEIRSTSYTGTLLGSRTGPGIITVSSNLPVAQGSSLTYYVRGELPTGNGGDDNFDNLDTFTITRGAAPVAPAIGSVTDNAAATTSVTTTVNLSSSGSGGTLEYAQTTSNSIPSTGWQLSSSFSHPRGATRYYWASRNRNISSFASSLADTVGYLTPETTGVAVPSFAVETAATSHTAPVSGTKSTTTYQIRLGTYNGTVLSTAVGNDTSLLNVLVNDVPTAGSAKEYFVTAYRQASTGGSGTAGKVDVDSYVISRPSSGGSGSGGSGTTATYGVECYGPDGTTLIWGSNKKPFNIGENGSLVLTGGQTSSTITCIGMTSTNSGDLLVGIQAAANQPTSGIFVARGTNSFTITNNFAFTVAISYKVYRVT